MTILVTGSRTWADAHVMRARLSPYFTQGWTLLHGGARGADRMAAEIAAEFDVPVIEMAADWDTHGRAAGMKRNAAMLDTKPDLVMAFWDGSSKGTKHCITEARRREIPTVVVTI